MKKEVEYLVIQTVKGHDNNFIRQTVWTYDFDQLEQAQEQKENCIYETSKEKSSVKLVMGITL